MKNGVLTDAELFVAVRKGGFRGGAQVIAMAVALAESSGRPAVTNRNTNGSTDYGLFQINSVHAELLNENPNWQDPAVNSKMAFTISSGGTNWKPWATYWAIPFSSGAGQGSFRRHMAKSERIYKQYMAGDAAELEDYLTDPDIWKQVPGVPDSVPNPLAPINDFFGMLTNPRTWLRLGFFIVGGALILIAFLQMTKADNVIAKNAAKVGAAFATKGKTL